MKSTASLLGKKAALFAILPAFLLFVSTVITYSAIPDPLIATKVHAFILAAGFFLTLCLLMVLGTRTQVVLRLNAADAAVLVFAAYAVINYATRLEDLAFCDALLAFTLSIAAYVVFKQFFSSSEHSGLRSISVTAMLLIGTYEAIYGLLQLHGYVPSLLRDLPLTGSFHNPGPYGIYLAAIFVFAFAVVLFGTDETVSKLIRNLSFAVVLLMLLIIPATRSGAAWLALAAVATGLLAYRYLTRGPGSPRWRRRLLIGGLVVALPVVAFASWELYKFKEASVQRRLVGWQISLDMARDNALRGVGYGNFNKHYGYYQANYFSNHPGTGNDVAGAAVMGYAHNDYIQVLAENGIVGLLLFLSLIGAIAWLVNRERDLHQKPYLLGGLAGWTVLLVCALFSYPFELISVWWLFVFFTALVSGEVYKQRVFAIRLGPGLRRIAPVMVLLGFGWLVYGQWRGIEAKTAWAKAETLALTHQDFGSALDLYARIAPALSHDNAFLLSYGKTQLQAGNHQESIRLLEKARQTGADPLVLQELGDAYVSVNQYERAETAYTSSIHMTPNRLQPRYALAKMYLMQGDTVRAQQMARIILKIPVGAPSFATRQMQFHLESILRKGYNLN